MSLIGPGVTSFDSGLAHQGIWDVWGSSSIAAAPVGFFGTNVLQTGDSDIGFSYLTAAEEDDHIFFGVRKKRTQEVAGSFTEFALYGDVGTVLHVTVTVDGFGTYRAYKGDQNGTLLVTSDVGIYNHTSGTSYFEWEVLVHDSAGVVRGKKDGVTFLEVTGADTRNGGADALIDVVQLWHRHSYCADIYLLNEQGAAPNNTFLGPIIVECLEPNANGTTNVWDGSDADQVDNYLLVDDAPTSDGDDTYVESADAGDIDLYNMTPLVDITGTIFGAVTRHLVKDTGAGGTNFREKVRSGGANYSGATKTIGTSYVAQSEIRELDPATSAAWTIANVNALEVGQEVMA